MNFDNQSIGKLLRSTKLAWITGSVLVLMIALVAYIYVGWLGVGGLGICGLLITQNSELYGNAPQSSHNVGAISMKVLTQRQKSQNSMSPEEKLALEAAEQDCKRTRYIMNTFWIALTVLGFSMLVSP